MLYINKNVNDENILTFLPYKINEMVLNIMLDHFHSRPKDVIFTIKQTAKVQKQ